MSLSKTAHNHITSAIREYGDQLVFRRVFRNHHSSPIYSVESNESGIYKTSTTPYQRFRYPKTDAELNVTTEWSKNFYSITNFRSLRNNDEFDGETIIARSENFMSFNPISFEMEDVGKDSSGWVPLPRPKGIVARFSGDLICGTVSRTKSGKPFYMEWFLCSEQFLRLWTLLMYKDHSSIRSYGKTEQAQRRKLLSGNRLRPNSYTAFKLANPGEDSSKRYIAYRTESAPINDIHIYNAIALIAKWGELPTRDNVPNNLRGPQIKEWYLPENFVHKFITHWMPNIVFKRDIITPPTKVVTMEDIKRIEKMSFDEEAEFPNIDFTMYAGKSWYEMTLVEEKYGGKEYKQELTWDHDSTE